jgi:class 3 adenylate cyclase
MRRRCGGNGGARAADRILDDEVQENKAATMQAGIDKQFEQLLIAYSRQTDAAAKREIEAAIWQRFGAELSVLVLDMSGFSMLAQRHGIVHYLSMIRRMQLTALPIVESHQGRVVKFEADNCYAVFPDPAQAARAAIALNLAFAASNILTADETDIRIACGIDNGRVLLLGTDDLFGHAVNRASKLGEDVAESGEILITAEAMARIAPEAGINGRPMELAIAGIALAAFSIQY